MTSLAKVAVGISVLFALAVGYLLVDARSDASETRRALEDAQEQIAAVNDRMDAAQSGTLPGVEELGAELAVLGASVEEVSAEAVLRKESARRLATCFKELMTALQSASVEGWVDNFQTGDVYGWLDLGRFSRDCQRYMNTALGGE